MSWYPSKATSKELPWTEVVSVAEPQPVVSPLFSQADKAGLERGSQHSTVTTVSIYDHSRKSEWQVKTNREGGLQGSLVRILVWEVLIQKVTRLSSVHWWSRSCIVSFTAIFFLIFCNAYKAVMRCMSHSYDGSGKQHAGYIFIPVGISMHPSVEITIAAL